MFVYLFRRALADFVRLRRVAIWAFVVLAMFGIGKLLLRLNEDQTRQESSAATAAASSPAAPTERQQEDQTHDEQRPRELRRRFFRSGPRAARSRSERDVLVRGDSLAQRASRRAKRFPIRRRLQRRCIAYRVTAERSGAG